MVVMEITTRDSNCLLPTGLEFPTTEDDFESYVHKCLLPGRKGLQLQMGAWIVISNEHVGEHAALIPTETVKLKGLVQTGDDAAQSRFQEALL